jgi:hypothetical protein
MSARPRGVIVLLTLVGCGTTATIREGGLEHHVRIDRSTPSALIVQTNEGERLIPRAGISEIDHPATCSPLPACRSSRSVWPTCWVCGTAATVNRPTRSV